MPTALTLPEARTKFVETWGTLGSHWGISRTMAMIHALLMTAPEPLSTEDIMDALQVSRGNANQNLRQLVDWGLVFKHIKPGERREFFIAEKDIWQVARQIIRERRRREIEPVGDVLAQVKNVQGNTPETRQFVTFISELEQFLRLMQEFSDLALRLEKNRFTTSLMKGFNLLKPQP